MINKFVIFVKIRFVKLLVTIFFSFLTLAACSQKEKDNTALYLVLLANLSSDNSVGSCATTGPCKIFATAANATVNAGISGLDSNCSSDSNKPAGGGTYKALVSDGTNRRACTTANCGTGTGEHINWVLKPNKEYRQADGTTVIGTTTSNGVFTFPLTNAFQTTITGTNGIVTGLNTNWTSNANDCSDWSTNAGGTNMSFAVHDDTTNACLSVGTQACNNVGKVVCVEQ